MFYKGIIFGNLISSPELLRVRIISCPPSNDQCRENKTAIVTIIIIMIIIIKIAIIIIINYLFSTYSCHFLSTYCMPGS